MEKLKSQLGGGPRYTPVETSDQNEDGPESSQRDTISEDVTSIWVNTRSRIAFTLYLAFAEGLVIISLVLYIIFSGQNRANQQFPLGTDPSGFVPQGKPNSLRSLTKSDV